MTIRYLNPVQEADVKPANLAPRLSSLDGVRLGFLSNSKQNADKLLELVAEELKSRFSLNGLVHENKFNAGTNCPPKLLDELVSKVDAVITAIGDWGSCSSCSLHDGIEIDNRGKPAAVLVSEPFIPTAQAIAKVRDVPNYPFAVIKHPIGSLTEDEVRQRARDAVPQIIEILCGKD